MTPDEYRFLSDLLKQQSGLSLGDGKEYLIESRLPPVAAAHAFVDLRALIEALRRGAPPALTKAVCDAMTTGETLFFRDTTPFTVLKEQLLPAAVTRARELRRPVRIWCAACSTGQEPYSIAMLLAEMEGRLQGTPVEILATDYSAGAIARAKEGVFNQFEVQRGLPVQLLVKFFRQTAQGFKIVPEIRQLVTFGEANLLKPFPGNWQFDVIFCRNVLIYFDLGTRKDVLERMAKLLAPCGSILLGGTESTLGVTDALVRRPGAPGGVYCRQSDAGMLSVAA